MAFQNETRKSKFFCPLCRGNNLALRGQYLSLRDQSRIRRETSKKYIKHLQEKYPDRYQAILDDNGGSYHTVEQLKSWYQQQRIFCLTCKKSFLERDERIRSYSAEKKTQLQLNLSMILHKILCERFLSKHGFIKFFQREYKNDLINEKEFEDLDGVYSLVDLRTLKKVYEDNFTGISPTKNIRMRNDDEGNIFHFFSVRQRHRYLKKEIKVIFCVSAKNFRIRNVLFPDDINEFKRRLLLIQNQSTINLPEYFLRKCGIKKKPQADLITEANVYNILEKSGFKAAASSGATLEQCKQLIWVYCKFYNQYYLNKYGRKQ